MKKRLLSLILFATMIIGSAISANAATSQVDITIEATKMDTVSVTVPTALPIVFNEDGSNTIPDNWEIENVSSIAGIHLSQIDMNANGSGWQLLAADQNTKSLAADTKSIKFYAGTDQNMKLVVPESGEANVLGTVTYGEDEIAIASGETQLLSFDVERGAFTQAEAAAKAFDMVLTFNFN